MSHPTYGTTSSQTKYMELNSWPQNYATWLNYFCNLPVTGPILSGHCLISYCNYSGVNYKHNYHVQIAIRARFRTPNRIIRNAFKNRVACPQFLRESTLLWEHLWGSVMWGGRRRGCFIHFTVCLIIGFPRIFPLLSPLTYLYHRGESSLVRNQSMYWF